MRIKKSIKASLSTMFILSFFANCTEEGFVELNPSEDTFDENPVFVMVHGSWHGSWAWEEVKEIIERQHNGFVHTVDLPLEVEEGPAAPLPI